MLNLPEDIPSLVEQVYNTKDISKNIEKWFEHLLDEQLKSSSAKIYELESPDEKRFCLAGENSIFEDDENQFMSVKTRMGEQSVRLALLPVELFDKVKNNDKVSRNLAKQVLKYSFSVRQKTVEEFLHSKSSNNTEPVCGEGLLCNLLMFPAENGVCKFENGKLMQMDYDEGFITKEKE